MSLEYKAARFKFQSLKDLVVSIELRELAPTATIEGVRIAESV